MLIHSRFVVVDDNPKHLSGIKNALDELRLDCHTKFYVEEEVTNWQPLPRTRILFLDMNLAGGDTIGSQSAATFAILADVIQKLICPRSGPYGIVLWAKDPQLEQLKEFLFDRFRDEERRLLPVFFAKLQKSDYINTITGEALPSSTLSNDILEKLSSNIQMKALFSWEADVSSAVDAVLRSMVDLVPLEQRATDEFGNALGEVLYRLSQAGAGIDRAQENPREAINRVLVPILADRIPEHDPQGDAEGSWKDAIVVPSGGNNVIPVPVRVAVNTALHLSYARSQGSQAIRPTELGAVVKLPCEDSNAFLKAHFGFGVQTFLKEVFELSEEEWGLCTPRLVQIGAACDAAQPKPGPLLYLFAVEWPFFNSGGMKSGKKDPKRNLAIDSSRKPKGLEWQSPALKFDDTRNGGGISVFKNLSICPRREKAQEWEVVYRFRDELVSQLTQEYARYISRPGIVSL